MSFSQELNTEQYFFIEITTRLHLIHIVVFLKYNKDQ